MNYKLAKQLKDAGWNDKNISNIIIGSEDQAYRPPTLSELIDACGEDFHSLTESAAGWWAEQKQWYIGPPPTDKKANEPFNENGKTPEEAVAKLWIKLNK